MRFRAWRGLSPEYRAATDGHSPWTADAIDVSPLLIEDAAIDPAVAALRGVIIAEGIGAIAFIPLVYRGRLLGKFTVYYNAPHHFSPEELRLTTTVAHHIAFGIARAQTDAAIAAALGRERTARLEADMARGEAERASQAKDQFLATLSHELRNPLGVLATAVNVLDQSAASDESTERPRVLIRRQIEHLARLLQDLLDVARITTGQIQLEQKPVELAAAVELAVDTYAQFFDAKRQKLTVSLPSEPVVVMGDAVRLQQVLGNLLDNASKYTDNGGSISVVVDTSGADAVLRIRDTGAGIPPDHVDRIFDLFAQVNPTQGRSEGGLGIGLTIARRILELHGGRIRAHSDGPGQGTEFIVEVPLAPTAALPAAALPSALPVTRRRILVIDDFDDGREMLVTALQLHGHEVFSAATGQQGIEAAIRHLPDIALVDIGLPDMAGYDVGREVRRHTGEKIILIALTGYGQPADRARSEEVGFHAHLVKPIDPIRLLEIVDQLT
jgi:two-component system CheB/CheR fusion protein